MDLDTFISKYAGKFVEYSGSANAKNQCVDLANRYIVDVLNLLPILWTNAIDFPNKDDGQFDFIENTPTGIPLKGDLMIFGPPPYGHISIFVKGDVNSFASFDQNFPLNSPCHIQSHNYNNVLGWMRPKESEETMEDHCSDWKSLFGVKNYAEAVVWKEVQEGYLEDERARVKFQESKIKVLETQYAGCEAIKEQNALLLQAKDELSANLTHEKEKTDDLSSKVMQLIEEITNLNIEIRALEEDTLNAVSFWQFISYKLFKN